VEGPGVGRDIVRLKPSDSSATSNMLPGLELRVSRLESLDVRRNISRLESLHVGWNLEPETWLRDVRRVEVTGLLADLKASLSSSS